MAVKQNALDLTSEFPHAARAVEESFYVDDGLVGADTDAAILLQKELQDLFHRGGLLLCKWNSSKPIVIEDLPPELKDSQLLRPITDRQEYTKALGVEWNSKMDHFRIVVSDLPPLKDLTKRAMVSDIAKTYDVLGRFSPTIVKVKILLQRLWECGIGWDEAVPPDLHKTWLT